MAIPTTRAKDTAVIYIDENLCNGCGLCVSVCKDFGLKIENNKAVISADALFGCIGCGHCMAICSSAAIKIAGRTISHEDLFELPPKESIATYGQLSSLLLRRRSIREFVDKKVETELLEKILKAAKTAPMGLPPSDVNVVVFNGKDKSRAFAQDFSHMLKSMRFMTSKIFLKLMRLFWGKENNELFRGFVAPLFKVYIDDMEQGCNYINYDAPLLMYFYGSPYCDPADPIVAATYAMIAAESLGLGTCMLGGVHPLIQYGKKAKLLREKYHIQYKSREGLFVAFGYPAVHYKRGISRTFASVQMI